MKIKTTIYFITVLIISCNSNDNFIIKEGGCIGEYYLSNHTGIDLYIQSKDSTLSQNKVRVPSGETKIYETIGGFNSAAEPWIESPTIELYKLENNILKIAYSENIDTDTIWKSEEVTVTNKEPCRWHYTFEINDSMLKK